MTQGAGAYFEDHSESKDLGRRALRGGFVSVAVQYGNAVLQIVAAIVLARLLAPADFGIVAIVTVLTSFAPLLIDFGLGDATAQRIKITRDQVSSLFWLNSAIGLGVGVVVAVCSPIIASIYHDPRLQSIAMYSAITFVLFGLSSQHLALLRRTMQFGTIAQIQILSTAVGTAVSILMAIYDFGYWALVLRPIVTALCILIGAWLACRWRPAFPVVDDEVKSMVRFGLHVIGFSVAYTLAKSVDRIGLGLFYRPDQVGYYQNAITLYEYSVFSVFAPVHTVGSTALSKLQSNPVALGQKYEAALSAMAFFVMPMAAILSVTAQDVTVLLLGEKWRAAGLLLSVIALRGIFQAVEMSQGWLHLSIGRADRWQFWGIVSLVVQVVAVLAGLPFGAMGVAVAGVIASILIAVPAISYAGSPIGVGPSLVIRAVGPQLIGAVCTVIGGWYVQTTALASYPSLVRIALSGGVCVCIYLFVVVVMFRLTEPIKIARTVVLDQLSRRRS
jgi:O-antigen/teichoic acid export membrane protein